MTPTCEDVRPLLSRWIDGELTPGERENVDDHLRSCAKCRETLLSYERSGEAIKSPVERSESYWEDLALRIERAIAREDSRASRSSAPRARTRPRWLTPQRLAWGSFGALAAAALVVLLQPLLPEHSGPSEIEHFQDLEGIPKDASRPKAGLPEPQPKPEAFPGEHDAVRDAAPEGSLLRSNPADLAVHGSEPAAIPSPALPEAHGDNAPPSTERMRPAEANEDRAAPPASERAPESEVEGPLRALGYVAESGRPRDDTSLRDADPPQPSEPSAGGASSLAEVEAWISRTQAGEAPVDMLRKDALRPQSHALETREEAAAKTKLLVGNGHSRETPGSRAGEDFAITREALARARSLEREGRTEEARAGFLLLTGDFAGNSAREEAWNELIALDTELALVRREVPLLEAAARSASSFLEEFDEGPGTVQVQGCQIKLWAALAEISPEKHCRTARELALAWRAAPARADDPEIRESAARILERNCPE